MATEIEAHILAITHELEELAERRGRLKTELEHWTRMLTVIRNHDQFEDPVMPVAPMALPDHTLKFGPRMSIQRGSKTETIWMLLEDGPRSHADLIHVSGIPSRRINTILSRMDRARLIVRDAEGNWHRGPVIPYITPGKTADNPAMADD